MCESVMWHPTNEPQMYDGNTFCALLNPDIAVAVWFSGWFFVLDKFDTLWNLCAYQSFMIVDSLSKNKTVALWPYHFHAALFIVWIRAAMSGHEKNMQQLFTKKNASAHH